MITITNIILGFTCLISISALYNHKLFDLFKFNAYMIYNTKDVWRFVSHILIHADWMHLIFNMYALYIFGNYVESFFLAHYDNNLGKTALIYVSFYVSAGIAASLVGFEKHKKDLWYNSVGASGAISALVFAFIGINPTASLSFIFLPVRIPGVVFGIAYLAYSWYMSRRKADNIDHDAHFFGAVYGFLFIFILIPPLFKEFIQEISLYIQHIL